MFDWFIIDGIYTDPFKVRNMFIDMEWSSTIRRFSGFAPISADYMARLTPHKADWGDTGHIHSDGYGYTGVVYLNLDFPSSNGTAVLRHIETGSLSSEMSCTPKDSTDPTKWETVFFCEGVFNRLFVIRSALWHAAYPKNGFGNSVEDSRMVQILKW